MKKFFMHIIPRFLTAVLIVYFGLCIIRNGNCLADDINPVLSLGTPIVKLSGESKVFLMGTGFKPGQELIILLTTPDGIKSDLGFALEPAPVADKIGSWASLWTVGDFVGRKIISEGVYKITVTDNGYNQMAQGPILFEK